MVSDRRDFERKEMRKVGRRRPYTAKGIHKIPCVKCGSPSTQQWQICSLNNEWFGVCTKCDIEIHSLVLKFFDIPDRQKLIQKYAKLKGGDA